MLQTVVTPTSLGDLRKALKQAPKATLMAGGTLVMPIINEGAHGISTLVSLSKLGLDGVSFKKGVATIGAAAPIAELAKHSELKFLVVRHRVNRFADAAQYGDGGRQPVCGTALWRSRRVSGGARCNGDNRQCQEQAQRPGRRDHQEGLKAGELVTQISFAIPKPGTFKYAKASRRALNSASIVTVAAVIPLVKGVVADCRIALGGVAAKPVRAKSVEKLLNGKVFDDRRKARPLRGKGHSALDVEVVGRLAKWVEKLLNGKVFETKTVTAAAAAAAKDIAPFTDAYASAWYRARVTPVHICRALLGNA